MPLIELEQKFKLDKSGNGSDSMKIFSSATVNGDGHLKCVGCRSAFQFTYFPGIVDVVLSICSLVSVWCSAFRLTPSNRIPLLCYSKIVHNEIFRNRFLLTMASNEHKYTIFECALCIASFSFNAAFFAVQQCCYHSFFQVTLKAVARTNFFATSSKRCSAICVPFINK